MDKSENEIITPDLTDIKRIIIRDHNEQLYANKHNNLDKWAHFGKTQVVKNWCQPEGKGQKCCCRSLHQPNLNELFHILLFSELRILMGLDHNVTSEASGGARLAVKHQHK